MDSITTTSPTIPPIVDELHSNIIPLNLLTTVDYTMTTHINEHMYATCEPC